MKLFLSTKAQCSKENRDKKLKKTHLCQLSQYLEKSSQPGVLQVYVLSYAWKGWKLQIL